jgi:hypothetical protein
LYPEKGKRCRFDIPPASFRLLEQKVIPALLLAREEPG